MGTGQNKMAAHREGERLGLNFKTFVVRRKAEYSMRFPFLTERQILAKLRKVWDSNKKPATSRDCKNEQAIQWTHGGHSFLPKLTSSQGRMCPKGDLSTFDVLDFDSLVQQPSLVNRKHHKYCHSTTHTPSKQALLSPTEEVSTSDAESAQACLTKDSPIIYDTTSSSDRYNMSALQAPSLLVGDSVPSNECSTTADMCNQVEQCQPPHPSSSPASCGSQPTSQLGRDPLKTLDNKIITHVNDSRNGACKAHEETSTNTCTNLRKEAGCCATNTLPFSSQEAQHIHGMESTRCGEMLTMTTAEDDFKDTLKNESHLKGSSHACVYDTCSVWKKDLLPCNSTLHDTIDIKQYGDTTLSSQEAIRKDDVQVAPLYKSPVIQSLPSLESTTPNPAKFLEHGARLMPQLLANSNHQINKCSVFETESQNLVATNIPSNESNFCPHDDISTVPLSRDISGSVANQINNNSALSAGTSVVIGDQAWNGRTHIQRRRKARTKSFWHSTTSSGLPGGLGDNCVTDSVSRDRPYHSLSQPPHIMLEDIESKHDCAGVHDASLATDSLKRRRCTISSDVSFTEDSTDVVNDEESFISESQESIDRVSSVQSVPGHTSPSPPPALSTAKSDLMCDMFELLTPERQQRTLQDCSDRSSKDVTSSVATSKRRVFRSVCTEDSGSSNFYSMFVNESDIFM